MSREGKQRRRKRTGHTGAHHISRLHNFRTTTHSLAARTNMTSIVSNRFEPVRVTCYFIAPAVFAPLTLKGLLRLSMTVAKDREGKAWKLLLETARAGDKTLELVFSPWAPIYDQIESRVLGVLLACTAVVAPDKVNWVLASYLNDENRTAKHRSFRVVPFGVGAPTIYFPKCPKITKELLLSSKVRGVNWPLHYKNSVQNSGDHPQYWKKARFLMRPLFDKHLPTVGADRAVKAATNWLDAKWAGAANGDGITTNLYHDIFEMVVRCWCNGFFGISDNV
eukprot:1568064-Rhodomonas_salina.1